MIDEATPVGGRPGTVRAAPAAGGKKRRPRVPPGLLRRAEAAAYCGLGASTWDRLVAAGLTPPPIKLAGSVLFSRRELAAWIDNACPDRATWAAIWTHQTKVRTGFRAR